jgi:hypothetical protein
VAVCETVLEETVGASGLGSTTVIFNVARTVSLVSLDARMVRKYSPTFAVGVPEITPVSVSTFSPAGKPVAE